MQHRRVLLAFALVGTVLAIAVNAWICDDAYITLRTVEALLRGDGLTWNPGVRVQAYTHPLWMGGLAAGRLLSGDAYAATLALCFACTAAALFLLVRCARAPTQATVAILALGVSPSFVQFSTSGLENPLTHVLLLAFFFSYVNKGASLRTLVLLTSLVLINRMDTVLLVAPALLATTAKSVREHGWRASAKAVLLGAIPFLLWELFSLVYYGSLVPNTAYAKLAHGVPRSELLAQGASYLWTFVTFDPAGAMLTVAGLSLAVAEARHYRRRSHMAAGASLYVLYLLWIGGDFMAGRMLTPVMVIAAASMASSLWWARVVERGVVRRIALVLCVLGLGALSQWHVGTALRAAGLANLPEGPVETHSTHWVGDEQHHYYEATGLLQVLLHGVDPLEHRWYQTGRRWARAGGVHVKKNIGLSGYAAADRAHIVDPYGLSEPFLARLPAFRNLTFHVGHYYRWVPPRYVDTVRTGECQMDEPSLCELWHDTRLVTQGPLWSTERFGAMVDLYTFEPSPEVAERFRLAHLVRAPANVREPVEFRDSGLDVTLDEPRDGGVAVQLEPCVRYRVTLHRASERVKRLEGRAVPTGAGCMLTMMADAPFDRARVLPLEPADSGDRFRYLGLTEP